MLHQKFRVELKSSCPSVSSWLSRCFTTSSFAEAKYQSSFQLIYWSCEDDNHLSLSTNSCKSNWTRELVFVLSPSRFIFRKAIAIINPCHFAFDRKYVYCVYVAGAEKKMMTKKKINHTNSKEEDEEGKSDWSVIIENQSPNQTSR